MAALDAGLKNVEAGLDLIPPDVEEALKDLGLDELHRLFRVGCNMACVLMAQKGWVLMMIKRKVGHGNFKAHLREQRFDYSYAIMCMNIARAIAKHPALAKIGNLKVLRRIAYLPEQTQAEIEIGLTAPESVVENGKVVKKQRHWKDLRPWVLLRIAADLKQQARKPRKQTAADPARLERLQKENMDAAWVVVRECWGEAVAAICKLVAAAESVQMKPEYFDEVFDNKWCGQLGRRLDRLSEILTPYEEIKRRGLAEE
jgi:hypothetical protein